MGAGAAPRRIKAKEFATFLQGISCWQLKNTHTHARRDGEGGAFNARLFFWIFYFCPEIFLICFFYWFTKKKIIIISFSKILVFGQRRCCCFDSSLTGSRRKKMNKLIFVFEIAHFLHDVWQPPALNKLRGAQKRGKKNVNLHAPMTTVKWSSAWRSLVLHSIISPESNINLVFYYLETGGKRKKKAGPLSEKRLFGGAIINHFPWALLISHSELM